MKNNVLDKFYTNPVVVEEIVKLLNNKLNDFNKKVFIEPSAGSGNFIDALLKIGIKPQNILAFDIAPEKNNHIKQQDYLKLKIKYDKNNLIIGNPPFGKNGKLALEFLNKGLKEADIVIFILPYIFKRYSMQKKVSKDAKLVLEHSLPKYAFLVDNKPYKVNCILQVWTNPNITLFNDDKRIKTKPLNKIDGIVTFIYNNTKETLKYFNKNKYQWDFAVVRQGWYDYSKKIYNEKELSSKKQYFFVKIINPAYKKIVDMIDFTKLSSTNTTVPGFSTTDFIKEVISIKESFESKK